MHNLAPHEPAHEWIERRLAQETLANAHQVIVHSNHARSLVAQRLGHEDKLQVIPHGNYLNVFPASLEATAALRRGYGLDQRSFVYLSFGQVRRYKRLPELALAFRALAGDRLALLIAGEPRDEHEAAALRELAAQDSRIRLDLRRIPASEVEAVHRVADAAVFAYDMFSSGSVLLALSHGLPVVLPADSTGSELVNQPAMEAFLPDGLVAALRTIRDGDQRARKNAALAAAARYDWGTVGRRTAEVYGVARDLAQGTLPTPAARRRA